VFGAWWSWAVLGVVGVLVGSVTFVAMGGDSPAAPAQKPALAAPKGDQTQASTTTTPKSTTTSKPKGHQGQVTSSRQGVAANVPLGDYAGEADPAGVASFAAATGAHVTYATDYLDKGDGWAGMDSATNIKAWTGSPYRLAIGVPILPGVGTLAEGATGAYDQYFTTLGENLVSDKEANAILRLGWEFNGNWFTWSVATTTDANNFVAFWRQIVTTMRAVPGEKFKFLWNPNGPSPTTYTPSQAYPGNAYVDYVGTDVYDNFWGTPFTPPVAWAHQLSQQWGLDWLAAFAAEQNKPIAIPEWSDEYRTDGHGLGDDPLFIDNMANWFVTNDVAFANVWCYDSSATYRNNLLDGTFPKALAMFKADFG
jgi:Glycosyl hydrolase family 26